MSTPTNPTGAITRDEIVKLIAKHWLTAKGTDDETADELSDDLALISPEDHAACVEVAQALLHRLSGFATAIPSGHPAYATDFDRISCMASREDVEEVAEHLSARHRGNEIYALAVIGVYRNGQRVSDEHPTGEDAEAAESRSDASAVGLQAETPKSNPPPPSLSNHSNDITGAGHE